MEAMEAMAARFVVGGKAEVWTDALFFSCLVL
jgi:hypothetical protein